MARRGHGLRLPRTEAGRLLCQQALSDRLGRRRLPVGAIGPATRPLPLFVAAADRASAFWVCGVIQPASSLRVTLRCLAAVNEISARPRRPVPGRFTSRCRSGVPRHDWRRAARYKTGAGGDKVADNPEPPFDQQHAGASSVAWRRPSPGAGHLPTPLWSGRCGGASFAYGARQAAPPLAERAGEISVTDCWAQALCSPRSSGEAVPTTRYGLR